MATETWMIRGVDKATRKTIRMYAIERGITIAEALAELINAHRVDELLRLPVPYRLESLPNGNYEAIWQSNVPMPGLPSIVKGQGGTSPLKAVGRLRDRLEEYKIIEAPKNVDPELAEIAETVDELEGK